MAGSSANWFRPSGGPFAGQAVYVSKKNQTTPGGQPLSRAQVLGSLQSNAAAQMLNPNTGRPAAAMQTGGRATSPAVQQAGAAIVGFGKHKGKPVSSLPNSYQTWMLSTQSNNPAFQTVQAQIRTYQRAQAQAPAATPAPAQAPAPTPAPARPAAGPSSTAPTGQTPLQQNAGGSIHQAPNGQYGLYSSSGRLIKSYKTQGGATRALNKRAGLAPTATGQTPATQAPAQAPAARPTSGGRTSTLTPATMDVVIGDRTYKAQDSAGSLAIVKGKNGKFSVVDVHTGKLLSKKDTLGDARTEMHKHAPRHQSHVQKSLDSNGRAFETIRPPKGIKAGSTKNSLDDIMNMSESIVEASKHVYKNGQTVFNPKTRRGNGEVAIQRGGARGDIFMSAIQQAYGADALPQKVSKKELDRMLHAGEVSTTMVRGSGSKYKEFNDGPGFSSGETVRLHGAGAYTASQGGPNKRTDQYARIYTNGYKAGPNTLNVMGLRAGAKTVDTQTIGTQMMSWKRRELGKLSPSDPNWSQKRDFIEALTSDKGYFATAMGYDAITAKYGGFDGIIVLNRSALVVQDTFE